MSIPYTPPGVTSVVEQSTSSTGIPFGDSPTLPALVGEARGYQVTTENALVQADVPITISETGVQLTDGDVDMVTDVASFSRIFNTNYILSQNSPSGGTVQGDSVTTLARVTYPDAPEVAPVPAGDLTGEYRYAIAWYYGDDTNGDPIESGLDSTKSVKVTLTSEDASLSGIVGGTAPTTASGVATGKVIYRSKNLGTALDPVWGPWYRIAKLDLVTDTYTDSTLDSVAITRKVANKGLEVGDSILIQYRFANQDYYYPTKFSNLNDVIAKYGSPLDEAGVVNSPLSLAANYAYANGATEIVCVALPNSYTLSDVNVALGRLEEEEDVRVVAIADGSVDALTMLNAHVNLCNNRKKFRVGLAGRDGTVETVTEAALRQSANAISNRAIQLYSSPVVKYRNSVTQTNMNLGGQYVAAAMAGFYAGHLPHETATRRTLAGFVGLPGKKTSNSANVDAQNGLTVVEDRGGVLRVRHSISTDRSRIDTQEFAVTLAQHNMLADVIAAIDATVIGKIVADDLAGTKIQSIIARVLDRKVQLQTIVRYSGLSATPVQGDPTTYDVKWVYVPTYTINNISIAFSLDVNSGTISIGDILTGSTGLIL